MTDLPIVGARGPELLVPVELAPELEFVVRTGLAELRRRDGYHPGVELGVRLEALSRLARYERARRAGLAVAAVAPDVEPDGAPLAEVVGTAEAAEILGLSPRRVRAMAGAGELEAARAGRGWVFAAGHLEEVRRARELGECRNRQPLSEPCRMMSA